jgi:hypothetical protein
VLNRRPERPLGPLWLRLVHVSALGAVMTMFVWSIALRYPGSNGGDGPFFFRLIEAGKVSFSRWHELPLWNPYECGGVPLWDNPQSVVAAPIMLLMQPFTTTTTIAVFTLAHVVAGFVGMWLLCRVELRSSRLAAFVGACLFAFSAGLSNHAAGGHMPFVAFQFAPFALLLWRRAEVDARAAIGLGLLTALMLYEGGVYAPAFIGLMLAIETLTRIWSLGRIVKIVRAGMLAMVVALVVGAARLLPVLDQITHFKRPLGVETDFIDWQLLKDMYLDRAHALRFGHEYVWGEYLSYTGALVLVLAAVGLLLSVLHESWMFAVALALLAFMLGHFSHWAPWSLLKGHVPPFISMRVPARFRLLLMVFIAGWVAVAVDRLPNVLERLGSRSQLARASRVAVACIALFAAGDVGSHSIDIIDSQWNGPVPAARLTPSTRLSLGGADMAQFIDQPRQNRGRLECWEEWAPFAGAPLWSGDLPQARAVGEGAVVYSVKRTQNSFVVDVEASAPTTLQFNTSWARGWRTTTGAVREDAHQLVVDVPVGHHQMKVWYWPIGLTAGLVSTGLGLLLAIATLVLLSRNRGKA